MTKKELLEIEKKKKKNKIEGPIPIRDGKFETAGLDKLKSARETLIKTVPNELRDSAQFKKAIASIDAVIAKQTIIGHPTTFQQVEELRMLYFDFNEKASDYVILKKATERVASPANAPKVESKDVSSKEIVEDVKRTSIGKYEAPAEADELDVDIGRKSIVPKDFRPTVLEEIPEVEEDDASEIDSEEIISNTP